jgi:hypothetical protein
MDCWQQPMEAEPYRVFTEVYWGWGVKLAATAILMLAIFAQRSETATAASREVAVTLGWTTRPANRNAPRFMGARIVSMT